MKPKLTLTVRQSVIKKAKQYSRKSGKSISTLFEEVFGDTGVKKIKHQQQQAAERLLKSLKASKSIQSNNDDKTLIMSRIAKKYA